MSQIGLFYSSSTGNTEKVADMIKDAFDKYQDGLVTIHHVTDGPLTDMLAYDKIILGIPTWDIGELEPDWDDAFSQMDDLDLSGKQVAVYGLGDQEGYPDSYQDGVGILAKKSREKGAELVGYTSTDGHEYDYSAGEEDGKFMGLCLDEDQQPELTPERVDAWVKQLVGEFKLELPT
ncbi:MAG: flavodoxin [Anaerolineales bacterium]